MTRRILRHWSRLRALEARLESEAPLAFEEPERTGEERAARVLAALRAEPGRTAPAVPVATPLSAAARGPRLALAAALVALAVVLAWTVGGEAAEAEPGAPSAPVAGTPVESSTSGPTAAVPIPRRKTGLDPLRELMGFDAGPLLAAADQPLFEEAANLWSDTSRAARGFVRAIPGPLRPRLDGLLSPAIDPAVE